MHHLPIDRGEHVVSGYPRSPLQMPHQALNHRLQALPYTLQRCPAGLDVLMDGSGLVVQRVGS